MNRYGGKQLATPQQRQELCTYWKGYISPEGAKRISTATASQLIELGKAAQQVNKYFAVVERRLEVMEAVLPSQQTAQKRKDNNTE